MFVGMVSIPPCCCHNQHSQTYTCSNAITYFFIPKSLHPLTVPSRTLLMSWRGLGYPTSFHVAQPVRSCFSSGTRCLVLLWWHVLVIRFWRFAVVALQQTLFGSFSCALGSPAVFEYVPYLWLCVQNGFWVYAVVSPDELYSYVLVCIKYAYYVLLAYFCDIFYGISHFGNIYETFPKQIF